jgi:hypothetical protein
MRVSVPTLSTLRTEYRLSGMVLNRLPPCQVAIICNTPGSGSSAYGIGVVKSIQIKIIY